VPDESGNYKIWRRSNPPTPTKKGGQFAPSSHHEHTSFGHSTELISCPAASNQENRSHDNSYSNDDANYPPHTYTASGTDL